MFFSNLVFEIIEKGGPIMWPIIVVSVAAVCVIVERAIWWTHTTARRNSRQVDRVFDLLQAGDDKAALAATAGAKDPVIRVLHQGISHPHGAMEGALEAAAGAELRQAGRFLSAMDTIVTLGPLLGLLGTVTGIMGSFTSIGSAELAVEKVTGGIGEALIATAAGLGIAIVTLIPMNFFHSRLASLQFDLESAANHLLILFSKRAAGSDA
jgi:biopolymer transport protein ExbB